MTSLAGAVGVSPELATLVRRLEHMGLST